MINRDVKLLSLTHSLTCFIVVVLKTIERIV